MLRRVSPSPRSNWTSATSTHGRPVVAPGGRSAPARRFGILTLGMSDVVRSPQRRLIRNRGGRGDRNVWFGRPTSAGAGSAVCADVVRGAEALWPHRRTGANEVV